MLWGEDLLSMSKDYLLIVFETDLSVAQPDNTLDDHRHRRHKTAQEQHQPSVKHQQFEA